MLAELETARPEPIKLRPYQTDARDAVLGEWEKGKHSTLLAMAVGTGKTETALSVLQAEHEAGSLGRSLWLAHRRELVEQPAERIRRSWPNLRPAGIVMAERDERDARVVIATVQTLASPGRVTRLLNADADPITHVVYDEVHHCTAPTNLALLKYLRQANPCLRLLGITATPKRTDGDGLKRVFESVAYRISIRDAIKAKALCPFVAVAVQLPVSLAGVAENSEGWQAEAAGEVLRNADAENIVVETWRRHAAGRPTIAFTASVAQAHSLARAFRDAGITADSADGTTETEIRADVVERFRRGEVQVLANCNLWTEGLDLPMIGCILQVRPTKSDLVYVQMAGRGLRLYPGKADCIAEGQRVLTDQGLVPIERITTAMKVWDGEAFVSHLGAICKGEQEVINYAGLTATPHHKVWTADGWRRFDECARRGLPITVTGNGRAPVRETDGCRRDAGTEKRRSRAGEEGRQEIPLGPLHDLRIRGATGSQQSPARHGRLPKMRQPSAGAEVALSPCPGSRATMQELEGGLLRSLWGEGCSVPLRVATGDGTLGSGESGAPPRPGDRPYRQQRSLRTGQPALCDWGPERFQQFEGKGLCGVPRFPAGISGCALRGFDAAPPAIARVDASGDPEAILPTILQTKRRVWDILNAGPRHRFTVEGLLVSNCLILDFVPEDARDLRLAGDLLGKPRVQRKAEAKAKQLGIILDSFGILGDGEGIDADPDEVQLRVMDYFSQARLAWTFDGRIASAAIGERAILAVRLPEADRVAKADALRAAGEWNPRWDATYQAIKGFRVYVVEDRERKLLGLGESWEDASVIAEEYAEENADGVLAKRQNGWRGQEASEKQERLLRRWNLWRDGMSKGAAAQAITHKMAMEALRG